MRKRLISIVFMILSFIVNANYKSETLKNISDLNILGDEKKIDAIIYNNKIDFSTLTVSDRKKAFISMLVPSILILNNEIIKNRLLIIKDIKKDKLTCFENKKLKKIKKEYKLNDSKELLEAYDYIPIEIVLSQAIIESGWGQSRFFKEANNIFGIWAYSETDKKIKALKQRGDQDIYLKAYDSTYDSLKDYYRLINTAKAYKSFRDLRSKKESLENLVKSLDKYSELGLEYTMKIINIIEYNHLKIYSKYQIK